MNSDEPAFPVHPKETYSTSRGMTLRDYFAAKAMQGLTSNHNWEPSNFLVETAKESYAIADAMLKEREKQS